MYSVMILGVKEALEMDNYQYFIQEFKRQTKIDLGKYKETQMIRRLENLMQKKRMKDFKELADAMKTDRKLVEELKSYMTINVTEFLRNGRIWADFQDVAVPRVSQGKRKIRIWSAACSSGEEPYTIAILMKEHFPGLDFEIVATDLDAEILVKAKEAVYQKSELSMFDSGVLTKYFDVVDAKTVRVKPLLKNHIQFDRHNLLEDIYPRNVDIIVCRNVMIYFTDEAKDAVFHKFSQCLNKDGILFIGATEQIFKPEQYKFSVIKSFYYQKKS